MISRAQWGGLLMAFLVSGCGGGMASQAPDEQPQIERDLDQVAAMSESIESLDATLDETLQDRVVEEVDPARCEQACGLCLNVCDLADRICLIADRNRDNRLLFERCIDGRVRCKRGTRDTDAVCDCSEVELRIQI